LELLFGIPQLNPKMIVIKNNLFINILTTSW